MSRALSATSRTLQGLLEREFTADTDLGTFFDPNAGGTSVVSLNTPQEMQETNSEGVSVWLYRVVRDDQRSNSPPVRVNETQVRRTPLPVRLHYLITPIVNTTDNVYGPEQEQIILGKILQIFYDHPKQQGSGLPGQFIGPEVELHVRLEPLSLEEITRVWDALDAAYQLSVSYEVTVVEIESELQPRPVAPVQEVLADYNLIVGSE